MGDFTDEETTSLTEPTRTRLGDLERTGALIFRNGFAEGRHDSSGRGIPHLRPFNVSNDGNIDLSQIKYVTAPSGPNLFLIKPGDVIFNNTNSEALVGKTALFRLDRPAVHSNHMTAIRVRDACRVAPDWLAFYLLGLWKSGVSRSLCRRHVNQASISLDRLRAVEVALPAIAEQREIARVLRTVQRAKEAAERVIAATRHLKRSILRHLFTYGPTPVARAASVPLRDTEIGPMPAHWDLVKLGDLAELISGGTPSRAKPEYWGGAIPWVKTGEVNYRVIRSTEETLTEAGVRGSAARIVPAGTLLVAMYGQGITRGRAAILGINAAVNQACAAIFPDRRVSAEFLYYVFVDGYERVRELSHGAHQLNLSLTLLRQVAVPVPPPAEQADIVRSLSAVDAKLECEVARRDALSTLFDSLLHDLMTGKRRVAELSMAVA